MTSSLIMSHAWRKDKFLGHLDTSDSSSAATLEALISPRMGVTVSGLHSLYMLAAVHRSRKAQVLP